MNDVPAKRIWVDVEDLFQYASFNSRPSGIQRVVFELCRALAHPDLIGDKVGFLRHDPVHGGFVSVSYARICRLQRHLTEQPSSGIAPRPSDYDESEGAANPGRLRRLVYRLPTDVRRPAVECAKAIRDGGRSAGQLARAIAGCGIAGLHRLSRRRPRPVDEAQDAGESRLEFPRDARPGDVLLVPGSPWFHPFYATLLDDVRRNHGLRTAVILYDLIPLIRPEWCDRNLVARFGHWVETVLPVTDIPLAISDATAKDVERVAAARRWPLLRTPTAVPMGTGFTKPDAAGDRRPVSGRRALPAAGSYALIVSTIEARKNHRLLFAVWRRLLDTMDADAVPTLVFAGRVGWLVADLMQQLRNADWLDRKVLLIEDASDAELEQLYRGSLFTLFPSFYEGWGLPVTESLGLGRPCIASNASALPEAGGTLARYFDPQDGNAAYREIRRAIEDRAGTEAWADRVKREFRPVAWTDTVRAILAALD